MRKRREKKMIKLARVPSSRRVKLGRQNRKISLEMKNELLSNQIAQIKFKNNTEVLKVNKAGVITNFDYNNPNHKRWLED
ncbi:hypothetical protein NSQ95_09625 [Psychrobacillus sp. FSL W7-1457]|uniref:hypothetical protein n=2 Tax=Psychrobacillus TaxID=1221880 RepID=UPI00315A6E14